MATLEQLENALRKAHAAGNADHARAFAAEIRRMRESTAPKADFSNVQGGVSSTESLNEGFAPIPAGYGNYRPTLGPRQQRQSVSGMSAGRKLVEGGNSAVERLGRGVGQVIGLGLDSVDGGNRSAQLEREEAEARARDAELLATGWGRAGSIAGDVGLAMLPIGRAAQLGRKGQVAAGAATGAGLGFLQPVTAEESRGQNAAVGGAAGGAGSVVAPLLGRAVASAGRPLQAFTQRGAERQAREVVRSQATNPDALLVAAPSSVPGVQRTLAEETLDPGIAQLQRQFPTELADIGRANNNARVDYLSNAFGGADDAAAAAIRDAADAQAAQTARGLRSVVNAPSRHNPFAGLGVGSAPQPQAISLDPVTKWTDALIRKNDRRPVVQSALGYVRDLSSKPVRDASEAWNLRKTINDLMEGRVGGDQAAAKAARRELISVRNLLDRQMSKAYPEWGKYLREYKAAQREAGQVDTGAFILRKGGVEGVDAAGNAVRALQPGKFRNLTDDMDRVVQSATGFPRARAQSALSPGQLQAVGDVRSDIVRQMTAESLGRGVGSPTSLNDLTNRFISEAAGNSRVGAVARNIPLLGAGLNALSEAAEKRVRSSVAEILANPQRGRQILSAAPLIERQAIEAALLQAGGAGSIGLLSQP